MDIKKEVFTVLEVTSVVILMASLWQLDILWFIPWDVQVDLPFYLAKVNKYFYRDLLYVLIVFSFCLMWWCKEYD